MFFRIHFLEEDFTFIVKQPLTFQTPEGVPSHPEGHRWKFILPERLAPAGICYKFKQNYIPERNNMPVFFTHALLFLPALPSTPY